MRGKPIPSDLFLGAILRGYDAERRLGRPVTPSAIWDRICMECLRRQDGFHEMFAWDTRKASRNRIGTIIEVIEAGQVPGLRLVRDAKGRAMVEEVA